MAVDKFTKVKKPGFLENLTIFYRYDSFRDDRYDISYRLIILHAVGFYYKSNGSKKIGEIIDLLLDVVTGKNPGGFREEKLFELYSFNQLEKRGLILIDSSRVCFPLIFYPDDYADHSKRISALKESLIDLNRNCDFFEFKLRSLGTWEDIVGQLKEKFTYAQGCGDD